MSKTGTVVHTVRTNRIACQLLKQVIFLVRALRRSEETNRFRPVFLTDLMRCLTIPHTIDFMAVSSYGAGARASSGHVRITLDLQTSVEDKDVLLVEDIIDSGNTIASVIQLLRTRRPRSLKVCTLLDKLQRREADVPIHYRGFEIPNKFVFGYGLDLDEYYRNLPFIGVVRPDKYLPPD